MEDRVEPQLALFCGCGRRPVELREPGCCRLCYCRRYRSLRFFGGLRETILKRDRFRCRACGDLARLVVHHRNERNEKRGLITLCIGCHTRVHCYRALRRWVPKSCSNCGLKGIPANRYSSSFHLGSGMG